MKKYQKQLCKQIIIFKMERYLMVKNKIIYTYYEQKKVNNLEFEYNGYKINIYIMVQFKIQRKFLVKLLASIGSLALVAFSFLKLKKHFKKGDLQKQNQNRGRRQSNFSHSHFLTSVQNGDRQDNTEKKQRILYQSPITQPNPYKLILKKPQQNHSIEHIKYYLLLCFHSSKGYQGVVRIQIQNKTQVMDNDDLYIDFLVGSIHYMQLNNKKIQQRDIIYQEHKILIKKQWLSKYENKIQIYFSSKYAFLGDGLASYFPLDQDNKYSAKGQVIYVRNGSNKVAKIFPCLNILNPCQIDLQVLHHQSSICQSNSNKIQIKLTRPNDYPTYKFLFQQKSYSSKVIDNQNHQKHQENLTKTLSRFSTVKLSSIHDFFVFCSTVTQVRPQVNLTRSSSSKALKDIIIRYYTKENLVKKGTAFLGSLQTQITEIFNKIEIYKTKNNANLQYQCKVDIFFIDDLISEGDFYVGSILLNAKTIQRALVDRRLYYLLCRAFVGMGILMKKKDYILTLSTLMKLNQLTVQIFSECCDYIYLKNKQYQNIRNECVRIITNREKNEKSNKILLSEQEQKDYDMQYWLFQYYQKQCRYFVKNLQILQNKVTANVKNILNNLDKMTSQEYWTFFIARYPLIQFNVAEILIKISLKYKGVPTRQTEKEFAKNNFKKSKYYLKFFTYKQIANNIQKLIQLQAYGLQKILPYLKIKDQLLQTKYQAFQHDQDNINESKGLYKQFKKYNEDKNFHHITALKRQIKRIRAFVRNNLVIQRLNIQCSLMGWKLLQELKIYPKNDQTYNLITNLQKIKLGDGHNVQKQQQQLQRNIGQTPEQAARQLQQMFQDQPQKQHS